MSLINSKYKLGSSSKDILKALLVLVGSSLQGLSYSSLFITFRFFKASSISTFLASILVL